MKFSIKRKNLLKPLQQVSGLLTYSYKMPILSNLLLKVVDNYLLITSTDLEVEIISQVKLNQQYDIGSITVSARKLFDICRSFPENADILLQVENNRMLVSSGSSSFALATLPAAYFPNIEDWQSEIELTLQQKTMKRLIEATKFSMAFQDVRYYLNGMLFEIEGQKMRTVATDGHRLAICSMPIVGVEKQYNNNNYSVIVPRKGVIELMRMLENNETKLHIKLGKKHIRVQIENVIFTSKLIDGCFPDYRRVLEKNYNKKLKAGRDILKHAFARAAIISNDKFRGVSLYISKNKIKITSKNQNNEEIEEILDVTYTNDNIEICFNVSYLLDVFNALKCDNVLMFLKDSISSVQIEDAASQAAVYVIMPIRL